MDVLEDLERHGPVTADHDAIIRCLDWLHEEQSRLRSRMDRVNSQESRWAEELRHRDTYVPAERGPSR